MKKFINATLILVIVGISTLVVGCYGDDRCRVAGEFCHWAEGKICCGGLTCEGPIIGESRRCVPIPGCVPAGARCSLISNECCYPYQCSAMSQGTCLPRNKLLDFDNAAESVSSSSSSHQNI